jgi:hypothetical protein
MALTSISTRYRLIALAVSEMKMTRVISTAVIQRFMSMGEYQEFLGKYKASLRTRGGQRGVTEKDLKILEAYQAGKSPRELAKEFGISVSRIWTAVRIAALSKLK